MMKPLSQTFDRISDVESGGGPLFLRRPLFQWWNCFSDVETSFSDADFSWKNLKTNQRNEFSFDVEPFARPQIKRRENTSSTIFLGVPTFFSGENFTIFCVMFF